VSDLVDRLRVRWEAMGDMANDEREEAANAICNLRADLQNAYDRIKTLTDERDEARREICMNATNEPYRQMCGSGILLPQDAARERGWDCYKEDEG
jgi:hypothetical protein